MSHRKTDAIDIDNYQDFQDLVKKLNNNAGPGRSTRVTIYHDMQDIQKAWRNVSRVYPTGFVSHLPLNSPSQPEDLEVVTRRIKMTSSKKERTAQVGLARWNSAWLGFVL